MLIDILVLLICAILCGAESVTEVEDFGPQKREWLEDFLELPGGIPSHDTIARVLYLINSSQLELAFKAWAEEMIGRRRINSISLDGKTINGTERGFNTGKQPLALVSVYAHELGLCLMQTQSTSTGLSEVSAAVECLKVMDLDGVTVMADAGVGTKTVLHQIRTQKGNYLVPIKKNSRSAFEEIAAVFEISKTDKGSKKKERGHGREEERFCRVLSAERLSTDFFSKFPDAEVIMQMRRVRVEKDTRFIVQKTGDDGKQYYEKNLNKLKRTEEVSYYVTNLKLTPQEGLIEIRKHWQIENQLHWTLDFAFKKDSWTVRAKRLARSLSAIRKIANNIIKKSPTKGSGRARIKKAGWSNDFLGEVLWGGRF